MMRCQTARVLMMERLYESPGPDDTAWLEKHLAACPACAAGLVVCGGEVNSDNCEAAAEVPA